MAREQIPLRLEPALLDRLKRASWLAGVSRNMFIIRAIQRALDGAPASYTAGYQTGYRAGAADASRRFDRAIELMRGGMDITAATDAAFTEGLENDDRPLAKPPRR